MIARLLLLAAIHSLFAISIGLLLLLPVFLREQGASRASVGLIMGIASGTSLAVRPAVGWALDRLGRRRVIFVGTAVAALSGIVYLGVEAVAPRLYGARVLTGIASGMLFTAFFTYASDVVPVRRQAQGLALFGISGMLPMSFAPAVGERLVALAGFEALFVVVALAASGAMTLGLLLPDTSAVGDAARAGPRAPWTALATDPALLSMWLLAATFGVGLAAAHTFAAPAASERAAGAAGWFFGAYGAGAVGLRLVAGSVPDRVGLVRVMGPSLAVFAGMLCVLAFATAPWQLALAGALGGLGHGFAFPTSTALVAQRAPPARRGAAMSALTGTTDLCFLVAAPALGWVGDRAGFSALFGSAAVAVVAGLIAWGAVERALARRPRP